MLTVSGYVAHTKKQETRNEKRRRKTVEP